MKLHPMEVVPNGVSVHTVHSTRDGQDTARRDFVAQEVPVALVFNGISHAVMMASPCDLEDFALGFGLTEGLLTSQGDLYDIEEHQVAEGIEIHLRVSSECAWRLKERRRTLAGRTGCGLCGTDSLSQVHREIPAVQTVQLLATAVARAEQQLRDWQHMQQLTGATHAAAWVSLAGSILRVREDVGRHNALDKLIGSLTRSGANASDGFICITSRASFEMVQKAVAFGAGVLAAVSAPTALAIEVANASNLALAGYVRNNHLVAYSFPERFVRDGNTPAHSTENTWTSTT